jgi:hypothetical protein
LFDQSPRNRVIAGSDAVERDAGIAVDWWVFEFLVIDGVRWLEIGVVIDQTTKFEVFGRRNWDRNGSGLGVDSFVYTRHQVSLRKRRL